MACVLELRKLAEKCKEILQYEMTCVVKLFFLRFVDNMVPAAAWMRVEDVAYSAARR